MATMVVGRLLGPMTGYGQQAQTRLEQKMAAQERSIGTMWSLQASWQR
ncbi:hypothetical protein [uncultured Paraglaciecola sp.]|nr:hypothetical protein [uncultured Paraglaciecola sp.]